MKPVAEETLDPGNWNEFRQLAHRILDDALDFHASVRDRPVWQPVPENVQVRFAEPVPHEGAGESAAYRDYQELLAPYALGNIHPRFWGWVNGTGTPLAMLSDLLCATLNVNAAGFNQGATFAELQLLDWLKDIMGFPKEASGILTSGGSVANLVALNVARNAIAPFAVRKQGLAGNPRLVVYASTETHNSVQKAVELMGLGAESLALIPVDEAYRMDVSALRNQLHADRQSGKIPFCVVANAGTVNTGAVDPLEPLGDLCRDEKVWLHVDGAFGAFANLDPARRDLVRGMQRADSLAFDLHKWMYMPYDVGCTLVRSEAKHKAAFAVEASYLHKLEGGVSKAGVAFGDYGPQLSRSFRALKAWMNIKAYGIDRFARLVAQNVQQAQYLKSLIDEEPKLELLAPVPLNIVNFRYIRDGLDDQALDRLNAGILIALQERGIAVPSSTVLRGRFAIRVAITNHRSRREDFDLLVASVMTIGNELTGE
ncbi:MAG TPA: aminotransferase class V-fold PLP-dependent enzyme [Gammaproteobacteria bacterium]|nr:aminotransferase class V-fold PLP-dependent enzyme [Gammaproteobacteria bacterium]